MPGANNGCRCCKRRLMLDMKLIWGYIFIGQGGWCELLELLDATIFAN